MAKPIETVFRDYETDGVPSSGAHKPIKSDIRDLLNEIGNLEFDTLSAASNYSPLTSPGFINIKGHTSVGDHGGALYKNVASEPSHEGKFSITLSGGGTAWFEIAEATLTPQMFGWVSTLTSDNQRIKIQNMYDAAGQGLATQVFFPAGTYTINAPYRDTDGIYTGYVANDEVRRANKGIIIYDVQDIHSYFDPSALIDRSGDQISDTDYSQYSSTFYVSKSDNIVFHYPNMKGFQDNTDLVDGTKTTTSGDNISFNNGCTNSGVIGGYLEGGTNGIGIGIARTSSSQSADPNIPFCENIFVKGTVIEGCEHKVFLGKVDGFDVDIVGTCDAWESQRGISLHSCKNGRFYADLDGVFKTSVLFSKYLPISGVYGEVVIRSMMSDDDFRTARTDSSGLSAFDGIGVSVGSDDLKNCSIYIKEAKSLHKAVVVGPTGHEGLELVFGDVHAVESGLITNASIVNNIVTTDPVKGMRIRGKGAATIKVDATQSGYSQVTPNSGILLQSGADGGAEMEVDIQGITVTSTNRNARVLDCKGIVTGNKFKQVTGQASSRDYDLNYSGSVNVFNNTYETYGYAQGPEDAVEIADDAVMSLQAPRKDCIFTLSGVNNERRFGMFYITGSGDFVEIAKGVDVETSAVDLTGTTGTDGKLTVYFDDGTVKVENRLGSAAPLNWQFT